MTGTAVLEARKLGRRSGAAEDAPWLIRNVDIELRPGERLAIHGSSGSGKTVLLRSLARLDPLDSGEVRWHGNPIQGKAVPRFRSRVVYLHQKPALGAVTVAEVLQLPYRLAVHGDRRFDRARAQRLLESLGRSASFFERSRAELSGGEEQLVALVRALLLEPEVLLLDEPTAALDADTSLAVERRVGEWMAGDPGRRSVVWVCHDDEQRRRVADRSCRIEGGCLT